MNNPHLYRTAFKNVDSFEFLKEYSSMIRWRPDKRDSLLDVGCAGGDFTSECVQEILPKTFSRLVGVDKNENMIDYARKHFTKPNVSFEVLNICEDITEFLKKYDHFDHITSSLCLHLIPDQRKAFKNMFDLLTPTGDCLFYIINECPGQNIYRKMFPNWSEYMEDVDDFLSPYHQRVNPTYVLKKNLESAGFFEHKITVRKSIFDFGNEQTFTDAFKSINPFYERIPNELKGTFIQEYVRLSMEENVGKTNESANVFKVPYTILTVYARK